MLQFLSHHLLLKICHVGNTLVEIFQLLSVRAALALLFPLVTCLASICNILNEFCRFELDVAHSIHVGVLISDSVGVGVLISGVLAHLIELLLG